MTYAKHTPETVIFLAKPSTLLMRLFQVHLNLVLIVRVYLILLACFVLGLLEDRFSLGKTRHRVAVLFVRYRQPGKGASGQ